MNPEIASILGDVFRERFGGRPEFLVRSPGRVNLIGEHTDYNDGFVLPMAIDRASFIALRARPTPKLSLYSIDQHELLELDLTDLERGDPSWREYPKAMAWVLGRAGYSLLGFEAVSLGQVPLGAGLSSSASFELALARAFQVAGGHIWGGKSLALLAQAAENEWIGVSSGIMDPFVCALGRAGHALLVDCRSLEYETLPMPPGLSVVVLDTTTRRGLVTSAYNQRRHECERGARLLGVPTLRDADELTLSARGHLLDLTLRRRVEHVLSENERTLRAREALLRGDTELLGRLLDESHRSLRELYEVSSPALDGIVQIARSVKGCFGARMTGAGFAGCALALVEGPKTESFVAEVTRRYCAELGVEPVLYVCGPAAGAEVTAFA